MAVASEDAVIRVLRDAGAKFAFVFFVFGSRADPASDVAPDSDLDVVAFWGSRGALAEWDVHVPGGVDLVVLDGAPLWLTGRVAMHGRLPFDDDPPGPYRLAGGHAALLPRRAARSQAPAQGVARGDLARWMKSGSRASSTASWVTSPS